MNDYQAEVKKRLTKVIHIGSVAIGGQNPVVIQSMTNTKTTDLKATLKQVLELEVAGCEVVRISVPDMGSAEALRQIKKATKMPLVADVHFQADLAVAAIKAGVDKVRINPGNIGRLEEIKKIITAAKSAGIPVRLGINSGSLPDKVANSHLSFAEKLVKAAVYYVELIESFNFNNLVISVKSPYVTETIKAYEGLAATVAYPLHLGVTESGTLLPGTVKSAIALGHLLYQGIGDTIRVSLTEEPVLEVKVAKLILQSLGVRKFQPELISCPTCARCEVDLISLAKKVSQATERLKQPLTVAVMGCVVNGPGEAKEADVGLAAGKGKGVLFKKGKPIKTIKEEQFLTEILNLMKEVESQG